MSINVFDTSQTDFRKVFVEVDGTGEQKITVAMENKTEKERKLENIDLYRKNAK